MPGRPKSLLARAGAATGRAYYRLTGGRFFGPPGTRTLLLTTTGRRTGKPRTLPLNYVADDQRLAVIASSRGSDTHPAWYLNLQANHDVHVQVGRDTARPMRARTASREECDRLWPSFVAMYRGYATYRARTTREIPIVILEPASRAPRRAPDRPRADA